jgi:hypothetical protein
MSSSPSKQWPDLSSALSLLPFLRQGTPSAINAWTAAAAAYASMIPSQSLTATQLDRINNNNNSTFNGCDEMIGSPLNLKRCK